MLVRLRCAFVPLLVVAIQVGSFGRAMAQTPPPASSVEEAKSLYAEAHAHFVAGRCAEAMPLLLRSNKLVPSPNSGLLIARCEAVEGKRVEAATRFAQVEQDALNLVRSGETRYAETAAAAAREGKALREKLGTLRIRLAPQAGASVEIDGAPVDIDPSGDTVRLHEPGPATVTFVSPVGRRERVRQVHEGKESIVAYESDEPKAASPSQPPRPSPLPWTFYGAAGLAGVGLGSFVGFGLASESTYGDLETKCAPACQPADRALADRGRTYQTVANVGLVVGAVFAAVTGVLLATR